MSVLKKLGVFLLMGVAVTAQRGAPQTYPPTAEQRQMIDAKLADLTSRVKAGQIVKEIAPIVGGGGGGRADFAEAGGKQPEKIDEMLKASESVVAKILSGPPTAR